MNRIQNHGTKTQKDHKYVCESNTATNILLKMKKSPSTHEAPTLLDTRDVYEFGSVQSVQSENA